MNSPRALIFLFVTIVAASANCQNQDQADVRLQTINVERFHWFNPLEVTAFRLKDAVKRTPLEANMNATFPGSDDWLKDVALTFRNVAKKKIVGVCLSVDFPDTEHIDKAQARMGSSFRVGFTPERAKYNKDHKLLNVPDQPPLNVGPREMFEVPLGPQYEELKRFIETRQSINTVHTVWVRIVYVYFDDGTMFNTSVYMRPDPSSQFGYVLAENEEFRPPVPKN